MANIYQFEVRFCLKKNIRKLLAIVRPLIPQKGRYRAHKKKPVSADIKEKKKKREHELQNTVKALLVMGIRKIST